MGSSKLRERHDDRAIVLVVGVTTYQGAPESGAQGEGWQEKQVGTACSWQGREMRKSFPYPARYDLLSLES